MILKNVYFREIELNSDTNNEFKQKLGEVLDVLNHATENSYEQMTIDGFIDWVTDLWWINEDNIVIKVNGKVSHTVEALMNEIVEFWNNDAKKVIKGGKNRNFEFILTNLK